MKTAMEKVFGKSMGKKIYKKGFTLIELLVVISIIGLITSVILAALSSARAKALDARRKSDLAQISKAIEFYYDKYNTYPRSAGWCTNISNPASGWGASFQADIQEWLPKVPLDPVYANTYQDYFYRNIDGRSYNLYAELDTVDVADDQLSGCARIGNTNNEFDYRLPL
jgi:prepilin-type N-terminal cleavage/methylation domain-containing protein